MPQTQNYNLVLTDEDTTNFHAWRQAINGTDGSNMVKIDTALSEKANKSSSVELILTAAGWAESDGQYTQTIAVDGVTAEQNGLISVSQAASKEQREAARNAILDMLSQGEGSITVAAYGEKPTVNIPIELVLIG